MWNAIFTLLSDSLANLLPVLLLALYLQAKLNKEFAAVRSEMGKVSERVARIEGKLGLLDSEPPTKAI